MFQDLQAQIELFFNHLNWTYILMFVFVLYGVKNKEEFAWYNDLMDSRKRLKQLKTWIAGFIVGLFFCLFTYLGDPLLFDSNYVSQMLRSFMIVIIFNSVFNNKLKTIENEENK